MKAGTSWWYKLIVDHPGVADVAGRPKEVHFLDQFAGRSPEPADLDRYNRYFPRPKGQLVGEWTPRYLYDFWSVGTLAELAPQVRCLLVLRDPVDRMISGLTHDVSRGAELRPRLLADHFARGLYSAQLERMWRRFPRERTLVLQYERCVEDPAAELARTYAFLDLDDSHRPRPLTARENPTRVDPVRLPGALLRELVEEYRADVERVALLHPELRPELWATTMGGS